MRIYFGLGVVLDSGDIIVKILGKVFIFSGFIFCLKIIGNK